MKTDVVGSKGLCSMMQVKVSATGGASVQTYTASETCSPCSWLCADGWSTNQYDVGAQPFRGTSLRLFKGDRAGVLLLTEDYSQF